MGKQDKSFCWVNHIACVVNTQGDIVEMLASGAELNNASKYQSRDYFIIDAHLPNPSAAVAVWLDLHASHVRYGFVSGASIALTMLTGAWLQVGKSDTIICSGAATVGLIAGGVTILPVEWRLSPGFVTPAQIARWSGTAPPVQR